MDELKQVVNPIADKIVAVFVLFLFAFFLLPGFAIGQKRIHSTFFEETDYELNVFRIYGKEPGKTLLLIGGIQGDEPGGFLSADLYADFSLKKGNLIVVPRANFQSIVLKRRKINEDMNRKFADDLKSNYETKVVAILKKLISESDCLLNLHDGSGFFSEKWEGPDRNPKRYGQSIIADCETYEDPDKGIIRIGDMARGVSEEINKEIKNPAHHFHFNDHKTKEKTSLHPEQRKSATYYALYTCGVPAFGVETSKSLPLELKVRHHNLAINAFMKKLGIVPETPGIYLDNPVLKYLVVSINDSMPTLVANKQTIFINPGDPVAILHIEANYERGLSADIVGFGTINDMRKKISITKPTRIVVRKDYYPCGSVYFAFGAGGQNLAHGVSDLSRSNNKNPFLFYKIKINGEERICHNYEHVKLIRGDIFEVEDVLTSFSEPSDMVVNFKGYVGDQVNNTGEDRGYAIDTGKDLWKRYSLVKEGKTYQIIATLKNETLGKLFIDLTDPVLKYIVLKNGDGNRHCLVPGDTVRMDLDKHMQLVDIITNINKNVGIKAFVSGPGIPKKIMEIKHAVDIKQLVKSSNKNSSPKKFRIDVKRDKFVLGSVFLQFFSGDAS